ncbi:amidohydrolase family protein [Microbaculum marinum]|uniref:Amidohydrolase family protein n=1 Tax=Microbaculum marinum TaxID=1764581 RepID=A0AAW9RDK2_9HYPH
MRIFDAHFHVVDPRFPLVANQGFLPDPYTVSDYLAEARPLGITGGAVVSGSFQGFDQGYLLDALARLGPGFVGVTQLPENAPDADILNLHAAGVRAVRFNLRRGGSAGVESLEAMARRVHEIAGWHVELYADATALADLLPVLTALPKLSIDHLGLSEDGLPTLLRLVEAGARVKATGFARISGDVAAILRAVARVNPGAILFGTDLPSTRTRRFAPEDITLIEAALGEAMRDAVFHGNAATFYGIDEALPGGEAAERAFSAG